MTYCFNCACIQDEVTTVPAEDGEQEVNNAETDTTKKLSTNTETTTELTNSTENKQDVADRLSDNSGDSDDGDDEFKKETIEESVKLEAEDSGNMCSEDSNDSHTQYKKKKGKPNNQPDPNQKSVRLLYLNYQ